MRFVPAGQLPAVAYEEHIFRTGEVSTRENSWHDFFNALAWARFPRVKAALNARHHAEISGGREANRGPVRDALTLFDECGVVLVGDHLTALQAMVQRDWRQLFCEYRAAWRNHLRVFVLGHALLEKFLDPYKAITAHALVLQSGSEYLRMDDHEQAQRLDQILAVRISDGSMLNSSAELSPLPLLGIPGWWPLGDQDEAFYADSRVFRPPSPGLTPVAIHRMGVAA